MIIFLNGPPGCGKDTVADIIFKKSRTVMKEKLAAHLKNVAHAVYELKGKHDAFEAVKDKPLEEFDGLTPRQAYIKVDKEMLRPCFGKEYLGVRLAARIKGNDYSYVISDSGFQEEAWPVIDLVGPHNCVIVHISRPGTSFKGDSRSYWKIPGIAFEEINNNGDEKNLRKITHAMMKRVGLE